MAKQDAFSFGMKVWLVNPAAQEESWYYSPQSANLDMSIHGWFEVGQVENTVALTNPSREAIILQLTKTLRDQQREIRAEAESEANQIEQQIQNLLALDYTPSPAPRPDESDDFPF